MPFRSLLCLRTNINKNLFVAIIVQIAMQSLRCHRTRIHKNLFVAIIVQIAMRLMMCLDQYIARKTGGEVAGASSGLSGAIYDTPIFCEALYALQEYTKTVKFMWMFVEGLYLHNMIAVAFFSGKPNYLVYYSLGWGVPVLVLTAWIVPMTQLHNRQKCWFGYYYHPLIWILEGPRAAVLAVNLGFLLNIIRVLVVKLRETHTNEAKRVRKAVKAAIILLPLLGLTNFVMMLEPGGDDMVLFGVWVFSAHFLADFEGFFISLIYCFFNGEAEHSHLKCGATNEIVQDSSPEVRTAVKRHVAEWQQHRLIRSSSFPRLGRSLSVFTSITEAANTTVQPLQKNNSQPVLSEANGAVQSGTGNGAATNGQVQVPLLRFASRRFRRTSARETNSSRRFQVSEHLQSEQVQEQEI
ncbi:PDF receptor-like [Littorina saxatilis]|uniref:PDF receptor-like n=1 Tax=Littorina saxatilis TaxID=31220 RepID=UPI0038B65A0C